MKIFFKSIREYLDQIILYSINNYHKHFEIFNIVSEIILNPKTLLINKLRLMNNSDNYHFSHSNYILNVLKYIYFFMIKN